VDNLLTICCQCVNDLWTIVWQVATSCQPLASNIFTFSTGGDLWGQTPLGNPLGNLWGSIWGNLWVPYGGTSREPLGEHMGKPGGPLGNLQGNLWGNLWRSPRRLGAPVHLLITGTLGVLGRPSRLAWGPLGSLGGSLIVDMHDVIAASERLQTVRVIW
jgi:hypothetical protein